MKWSYFRENQIILGGAPWRLATAKPCIIPSPSGLHHSLATNILAGFVVPRKNPTYSNFKPGTLRDLHVDVYNQGFLKDGPETTSRHDAWGIGQNPVANTLQTDVQGQTKHVSIPEKVPASWICPKEALKKSKDLNQRPF